MGEGDVAIFYHELTQERSDRAVRVLIAPRERQDGKVTELIAKRSGDSLIIKINKIGEAFFRFSLPYPSW